MPKINNQQETKLCIPLEVEPVSLSPFFILYQWMDQTFQKIHDDPVGIPVENVDLDRPVKYDGTDDCRFTTWPVFYRLGRDY